MIDLFVALFLVGVILCIPPLLMTIKVISDTSN